MIDIKRISNIEELDNEVIAIKRQVDTGYIGKGSYLCEVINNTLYLRYYLSTLPKFMKFSYKDIPEDFLFSCELGSGRVNLLFRRDLELFLQGKLSNWFIFGFVNYELVDFWQEPNKTIFSKPTIEV